MNLPDVDFFSRGTATDTERRALGGQRGASAAGGGEGKSLNAVIHVVLKNCESFEAKCYKNHSQKQLVAVYTNALLEPEELRQVVNVERKGKKPIYSVHI